MEITEIKKHISDIKNFWTTMFDEETWQEISKDGNSKNPNEFLGFLKDKIVSEMESGTLTEISMFRNVKDTEPIPFPLEYWLYQTLNPIDETNDKVEKYRETFDKTIKESLPCCTVSASFTTYRDLDHIKKKNGLICIDIDRFTKSKIKRSNNCIDMQLAKEMLMYHPSTLYCGYSCSGDGIYAILKIFDANRLDEYFEFFRDRFSRIGINIDESCKDYTRLRFFSVDDEGYFNANAKAYKIPEKKKPKIQGEKTTKDNTEKIEAICRQIESTGKDITASYSDWIVIGAALYDEFGDYGVSYFHRISKNHPDYTFKGCEKKFNQCKKMSKKINVVFGVASGYGIRY